MAKVNRNDPKRGTASESTYSLMEFVRDYGDDAACLDWLWRQRFAPDGSHAHCPKCDQTRKFHRVKARPSYDCDHCGHHINPLAGTIFHKSPTSLHLWFYAMYLMASTRCGISAKQLERELGVTYKTAWRMFNLIRNQLMADDDEGPLTGAVEADETWHGGKLRNSDKRRAIDEGRSRIGQYVRAALDYLIYSVARANNNGVEVDGTQFPLEDKKARYWMRWTGKDPESGKPISPGAHWLKCIPEEVAQDLAHYQPWRCGWTKLLRGISNRDKHRHLHTLTTSAKPHIERILGVVHADENKQTFHFRDLLEVGVFLPTGEDVMEASHLIESEARALIRSYASLFKMPPPGLVQDELPGQRWSRP